MIYGCINPKYTDVEHWFNLLEQTTDRWYYSKGGYQPKQGDIICVYLTNRKGIIASVEVKSTGIESQDLPIVSDRQNRNSRQSGYYAEVKLLGKYNPTKPETINRCDLYGRRQDTFKVDILQYAERLASSFESIESLNQELRLELENQPETFVEEVTAEVVHQLTKEE